MSLLLELFLTFFKIGAFTFGGGYAMIALFENEFVTKKKWMTKEEFLDMVAIAESTPGPIAINSATYVGYKKKGVSGSVFATVGVCLPSLIIIYVISLFFDKFLTVSLVKSAFMGIKACVIYLIFSAGLKMLHGLEKNLFSKIVFAVVSLLFIGLTLFSKNFSSIIYILISGIAGVIFYSVCREKEDK